MSSIFAEGIQNFKFSEARSCISCWAEFTSCIILPQKAISSKKQIQGFGACPADFRLCNMGLFYDIPYQAFIRSKSVTDVHIIHMTNDLNIHMTNFLLLLKKLIPKVAF
jgi:hypothetical protein